MSVAPRKVEVRITNCTGFVDVYTIVYPDLEMDFGRYGALRIVVEGGETDYSCEAPEDDR